MNLNIRELQVFRAVLELGSVTAAASSLGMSQPAASKMLMGAEARLGFALFVRRKKRLIPTPEANAFYPGMVGALSALEDTSRHAENLRSGRAGQLSIATNPALAIVALPPVIRAFRDRWPKVSILLRAFTTSETINLIAEQRADLGLIIGVSPDPRTEMRVLQRLSIGCLLPQGHPLTALPSLTLADLLGQSLITLVPHQPVGAAVRRMLQDSDLPVEISVETSQSTIACALVRAGVGIAVLDGLGLREGASQGQVVRPLLPETSLEISVVLARHRAHSRITQDFLSILHESAGPSRRAS